MVKASLPKALADGRDLPAPNIHEVAVAWPGGGGMLTTWPLKPGDGVLLVFAQRSLEGWLSGNDAAPDDPRHFDLSDCVAVPGLRATGISADPDAVQCTFGGTTVRLEPGGVSRITGTTLHINADIRHTGSTFRRRSRVNRRRVCRNGFPEDACPYRVRRHGIGGPPVGA